MSNPDRLPEDLQTMVWDEYVSSLRDRMREIPDHIRALCGEGNMDTVLDWMAKMLQYPTVKPGRAIVLVGPEGCGKTLFGDLLSLLLGGEDVLQTSSIKRDWNRLGGVLLVRLQECRLNAELASINVLVTDQMLHIRPFYQSATTIPSFHRVLITTNAPLSPHLHEAAGSRRFTVIQCGVVNGQQFHEDMYDAGRMEAFRQFLLERKIE